MRNNSSGLSNRLTLTAIGLVSAGEALAFDVLETRDGEHVKLLP